MKTVYHFAIQFYVWIIRVVAIWNPQAKKWMDGRQDLLRQIETLCNPAEKKIWMHCPSLGEFEQGRPLLEHLRAAHPDKTIILTFFSPSGYEIQKNFHAVDHVFYLPADTATNARRLVRAFNPELAIFVKYDFWLNYLVQLRKKEATTILISGIFRPGQHFFGLFSALGKKMLRCFSHFFVQDEQSVQLLNKIGFLNVTQCGDTRLDRVISLTHQAEPIKKIEAFTAGHFSVVAGSTWPADEKILLPLINDPAYAVKWIIAPHEIAEVRLQQIESQIQKKVVRYSEFTEDFSDQTDVLLIDNIGKLSRLYLYAKMAYIGGGFGRSIHNILEPAAWGTPVIFGPRHHKFVEAKALIDIGAAVNIQNEQRLRMAFKRWYNDKELLDKAAMDAVRYINENAGATEVIIDWIDNQNVIQADQHSSEGENDSRSVSVV